VRLEKLQRARERGLLRCQVGAEGVFAEETARAVPVERARQPLRQVVAKGFRYAVVAADLASRLGTGQERRLET
jgi:hypothetical protein